MFDELDTNYFFNICKMGGIISLEMILYFISFSFKLMQCVSSSIPFQCFTCIYIPVKFVLTFVSGNW